MIIVCPECQSRYKVPAEIVSVSGREMKCANCSHQWFQEGAGFQDMLGEADASVPSEAMSEDSIDEKLSQIEEALIEETGDDVYSDDALDEDLGGEIDESFVSEIDFAERDPADEVMMAPPEEKPKKEKKAEVPEPAKAKPFVPKKRKKIEVSGGVFSGAFVGLLVFLGVFLVLLFMKDTMIEKVPVTKPLYAAMGFKIPVVGEGLVFDGIQTSWKDSKLRVQGEIVNLQDVESSVPRVELGFVGIDGDILDRSVFSVEASEVSGGGSVPFEYEIQAMPSVRQQTYSVKLSFLPQDD